MILVAGASGFVGAALVAELLGGASPRPGEPRRLRVTGVAPDKMPRVFFGHADSPAAAQSGAKHDRQGTCDHAMTVPPS